jgi:hypothetical protein
MDPESVEKWKKAVEQVSWKNVFFSLYARLKITKTTLFSLTLYQILEAPKTESCQNVRKAKILLLKVFFFIYIN